MWCFVVGVHPVLPREPVFRSVKSPTLLLSVFCNVGFLARALMFSHTFGVEFGKSLLIGEEKQTSLIGAPLSM